MALLQRRLRETSGNIIIPVRLLCSRPAFAQRRLSALRARWHMTLRNFLMVSHCARGSLNFMEKYGSVSVVGAGRTPGQLVNTLLEP